jgi:5-formyltetrahydrofolate cyclo-ligase
MNFTDIALSKTARERALLYAARPESVQRAVGRDTRENEGELIFPLCREGEEREREREREREALPVIRG